MSFYIIFLVLTAHTVLFPFYVYVYRGNRKQDEKNMQQLLAALLIASALLYIPMYISVRKLGVLSSVQQNQPQRYIFWQTLVVSVGKIVTLLPICIYSITGANDADDIYLLYTLLDITIIPFIIQVTYLGCNKRNVDALLGSFELKRILNFSNGFCISSSVQPERSVASS
ncbi:hypothetical protein CRE_17948 [Caenorhabditis remanei]|uniref:Serpentine receptor class gamma n=1 Tax=Caenorhabditis remanei TaxID=31234 RepID=E3MDQ5_CAERE|nr:hypothetical protein CRE_17948 [Caenorhabditis remanei]